MANYLDFEQQATVSIWIGDFSSQSEFDDYFAESINGDDADAPINRFAADIGVGFYDHDTQEAAFKHDKLPIKELLGGFSFANSYIDAAVADSLGIAKANAAVLLFDWNYDKSTMETVSSPLRFLGSFPYEAKITA